ncbi:MAG TPA: MarR family transcriptional regulator, partial [Kiloniellaceae bacterium]|nr:MarR family transcriptional regulator [Kiloniellaceae bacterium]
MDTADDLGLLLERLARVLQNEAHSEGLKPTQWEALRYLSRANRFSRTPSGVTAYLGMTKGTVSQT